jgi:hypothetical protein
VARPSDHGQAELRNAERQLSSVERLGITSHHNVDLRTNIAPDAEYLSNLNALAAQNARRLASRVAQPGDHYQAPTPAPPQTFRTVPTMSRQEPSSSDNRASIEGQMRDMRLQSEQPQREGIPRRFPQSRREREMSIDEDADPVYVQAFEGEDFYYIPFTQPPAYGMHGHPSPDSDYSDEDSLGPGDIMLPRNGRLHRVRRY